MYIVFVSERTQDFAYKICQCDHDLAACIGRNHHKHNILYHLFFYCSEEKKNTEL